MGKCPFSPFSPALHTCVFLGDFLCSPWGGARELIPDTMKIMAYKLDSVGVKILRKYLSFSIPLKKKKKQQRMRTWLKLPRRSCSEKTWRGREAWAGTSGIYLISWRRGGGICQHPGLAGCKSSTILGNRFIAQTPAETGSRARSSAGRRQDHAVFAWSRQTCASLEHDGNALCDILTPKVTLEQTIRHHSCFWNVQCLKTGKLFIYPVHPHRHTKGLWQKILSRSLSTRRTVCVCSAWGFSPVFASP